MRQKLGILFCTLIILSNPSILLAQTASPSASLRPTSSAQTTKNVVRNFKINLSEYSAFGSDCTKKRSGDANCDTQINLFDLSIWEIEFNSTSSPKRSDFNNDGVVNLLDYGIWRNTSFPQRNTATSISSLISNLQSKIFKSVFAQESGGEVNHSSAFISGSGNSMILNSLPQGSSQQIIFNQNGNPASAALFNSSGESYAEIAFTNSGSTIITTESNGIPVTISKTASGPIIENFRNPDGSLLAIKSWPSQASYDSGEPPLAVTIPGQGNTREILNMQPNGDGIVEKLDPAGNILSRTQLRSNGTIITEDLKNNLIVQSNTEAKFTNLSMKNNIGGQTQYIFYDGSLFAIIQTDGAKNAYISKPVDSSGSSWSFETLVDGVKRAEKTVTNPIAEAKSNTPDPQTLIQYINIFKQSSANPSAINFSDGFSSATSSMNQIISKANSILTLSQTQSPSVLGLSFVKEVYAAEFESKKDSNGSLIGVDINNDSQRNGQPRTDVIVQVFEKNPSDPTGGLTATDLTVISLPRGSELPNFSNMTPEQIQTWSNDQIASGNPAFSGPNIGDQAKQGGVNYTAPAAPGGAQQPAPAAPAQPAAPAAPAAPQQVPGTAANQTCDGSCAAARSAYSSYVAGRTGETETVQQWSSRTGGSLSSETIQNTQAISNAHNAFSSTIKTDPAVTAEQRAAYDNFITNGGAAGLYDAAQRAGISQSIIDRAQAAANIAVQNSPGAVANGLGIPGIQAVSKSDASAAAPAPPSAPAAAAAAAPGIPTPQSGFIGNTGFYSQVSVSTNPNYPPGTFESTIKSGGPDGQTVATQIHNPGNGTSSWTDSRGTTYTQGGAVTGYTPNTNPFAAGTTYALDATGNIVAVGAGTAVDANGRVSSGRSISGAELAFAREQLSRQNNETFSTTGITTGVNFSTAESTCFLPGTLISTPLGQKAIETLKPKDKVYSYNEETGRKQISDFKELDVNFVDEYLIINGKIKTTVYHPFYTVIPTKAGIQANPPGSRIEFGMTLKTLRADELQIGDILQNEKGQQIPVYSIEKVAAPDTTVYNLNNVSPNNNFFAENILVHNYSSDTTADGSEDPNPGGDPYNPDGSYTDSWAETGGWNPDYFSAGDISSGNLGGTSGNGDYSYEGSGKAAAGDGGSGWGGSDNQSSDVSTDPGNQGDQASNGSSGEGDQGQSDAGEQGGDSGGGQDQQSDGNSSGADSSGW